MILRRTAVLTKTILEGFDSFLTKKDLSFTGVVIGGGALLLLNVISRATQDLDVLDPEIDDEIKKASEDFSDEFNSENKEGALLKNWFNNGPVSLKKELPKDWKEGLRPVFNGKSIKLYTLSQSVLLKTKLFAYVDRDVDLKDLIKISPSIDEIESSYEWVSKRDEHPGWPDHVRDKFDQFIEILKREKKED